VRVLGGGKHWQSPSSSLCSFSPSAAPGGRERGREQGKREQGEGKGVRGFRPLVLVLVLIL